MGSLEPVRAGGKFLFAGSEKLLIKGATYGTFIGEHGFPEPEMVERDFAAMAASGLNAVRTYTVPPAWMLKLAEQERLRLLVGIPWEQHLTFLSNRGRRRSIERQVREAVRACGHSPAVLGYVVGNEIPPSIVRWHGRQRVERFIERLYNAVKREDPHAIVTYANFPSTEYLDLPFLDVVCFNLFIERREPLAGYLAQLHNIAGDRPLIVSELGLDSHRNGEVRQANSVAWQLDMAMGAGCAGCLVFAWTDEWHRAGHDVNDWDFGLVDRSREPKPALELARAAFAAAPFGTKDDWPRVSVIVCARNGARVIGDCISALRGLDYPDYETIVVDDGSSDRTAEIASVRGARVITTSGVGLSAARNIGIDASDGVIVAFCDDDCRPERDWLRYLVRTFSSGAHVGVGGPNLPPPAGVVGDSVAQAPGGPTHVLLSPTLAEHIPGCNMAFRRSALDAVGCFDPQFHTAGDDVDICWRLLDAGGTLGFSPAAMVWHEPRSTVRGYARQQLGYGRAEALLERKWPDRYNGVGHLDWSGATHGGRTRRSLWRSRWRVYHGPTGTSPFQSVYSRPVGTGALFPLAPERYFLLAALAVATLFQVVGQPVLPRVPGLGVPLAVLLLAACAASMVAQAMLWSTSLVLDRSLPRRRRLTLRVLVFWLCLLQPLTRMYGRTHQGLTPWRHRGPRTPAVPRSRTVSAWSESWMAPELWAERLANRLSGAGAQVLRGSDFDTWDLQVRVGPLAAARVRLAIEEHGEGRQMLRFKVWPRIHLEPMAGVAVVGTSAGYALTTHSLISGAMLAIAATWLGARIASQAAAASVLPTHLASKLPDRVRS